MNYNQYPGFGINAKIKNIQDVLNNHLGFSNVDFYGLAEKVLHKDTKTFVPHVYITANNSREVYYDGKAAPGGNVFFIDSDKHTTKDGILFVAPIKIVFMLNLQKLITGKDYRTNIEVQEHCLKLVKRSKAIDITEIQKGVEEVLKGFNIEGIKLNNIEPYHTFSINGNIKYTLNCNH